VAEQAQRRCGLVRRAARTWVGYETSLPLEDMLQAANAAAALVHVLDHAVCAQLAGRGRVWQLRAHAARLEAAVVDTGGLEVTHVVFRDSTLAVARAELHGRGETTHGHWSVRMLRGETGWNIERWRKL